jgi:monoamine oxidase
VSEQTQDSTTSGRLDYAIAGAGVSGLYTAWRLLADARKKGRPKPSITIYESGSRIGGRLLTWLPHGPGVGLRAELGGMRFIKDQLLVWNLLHKGLPGFESKDFVPFPVNPDDTNPPSKLRLLLRGVSTQQDAGDPTQRYLLPAALHGKPAGTIVADIIDEVLATHDNKHVIQRLLGGKPPTSRKDWDTIKPDLTWRDRRLWDVGFWNLISDIRTPETYQYVIDAFGYFSLTSNWNAAEAMQFMALDFQDPNPYMTLAQGYGALPEALATSIQADVKIQLGTRLDSFHSNPDGSVSLMLVRANARFGEVARNLVLAMPRRGLELLAPTSSFDLQANRDLKRLVTSVTPVPAFKLFMFYEKRWWEKYGVIAGRSVCDLPIRQTYYMAPDARLQNKPTPPFGLIMASYDDARAVDYWQGMVPPKDQLAQGRLDLRQALIDLTQQAGLATADNNIVLEPPPHLHKAPDDMIRHAHAQLALLHDIEPDAIPDPVVGAFADWGSDPFGGGWNFWTPQVDVKDVMTRIKTPLGAGKSVFVVGDGYSGAPGWVEGALTATEVVLQTHLRVDYPSEWLPDGYYLGW